jgi:hypothetical protein
MLRWHSRSRRRSDTIEVSVDVDFQQRRRVVGRPSRRLRLDTAEPELSQVKLIDKDIDRPDCHRLHSHPAVQGTECSGCDHPPTTKRVIDPPRQITPRVFTHPAPIAEIQTGHTPSNSIIAARSSKSSHAASSSSKRNGEVLPLLPIEAADFSQSPGWGTLPLDFFRHYWQYVGGAFRNFAARAFQPVHASPPFRLPLIAG